MESPQAASTPSRTLDVFTKAEWWLMALAVAYVACGFVISWAAGTLHKFDAALYTEPFVLSTIIVAIAYFFYRISRFYFIILIIRPQSLYDYLKQDFLAGPFNKNRYIRALPVFVSIMLITSTFTSLKTMIPDLHPFAWDTFWADMDAFIHFGYDPWQLLHPVLGFPEMTRIINVNYNTWLFIKFFVFFWMLFSIARPRLRMQFFYTYALTWIVNGSLLAILFSSAGPCFYEYVTGEARFVPLMDYLAEADKVKEIWALSTQDSLWEGHISGTLDLGRGISAMPSLHVSTAFIYMLLGLKSGWFWKVTSTAFYIAILLGSVHLGWHYAVDGYIATVTTFLLWIASGKIIERLEPAKKENSEEESG